MNSPQHLLNSTVMAKIRTAGIVAIVLAGAAFFGMRSSARWLVLLGGGMGTVLLIQQPVLGLPLLVLAALTVPFEFSTGTEVVLKAASLLVPALLAVWVIDMVRQRYFGIARSRTNLALVIFLLAGLFSLLVGTVTWDPAVPHSNRFLLVQLAQWALFAFSAGAFWLTASLASNETWLRRLTFFYLGVASGIAILRVTLPGLPLTRQLAMIAVDRAPYWMLLVAVAGGQLLFNKSLSLGWRVLLVMTLVAALDYVFILQQETLSYWIGVAAVACVLAWLRWPRLRWLAILLLVALVVSGTLISMIYDFAGGDDEWEESGGSRLALIGRVIEVTMRNPITGLGPAAYRPYARMKPLPYGRALWLEPQISSHNNYVDLFSHGGLLGLGLFGWFAVELTGLGLRLRTRFTTGFAAGYVNAMLAAWAGALVLMVFADWILPFVYNIGFVGFQASVLVWFFLGGLVALEQMSELQMANSKSTD